MLDYSFSTILERILGSFFTQENSPESLSNYFENFKVLLESLQIFSKDFPNICKNWFEMYPKKIFEVFGEEQQAFNFSLMLEIFYQAKLAHCLV